jgi:Recombinase/Recombinase zinc beta ribbon domain
VWDIIRHNVLDELARPGYGAIAQNQERTMARSARSQPSHEKQGTIQGRLALLRRGEWPHGKVPFGYDRRYVDPAGKEYLIPRRESFRKGKGWRRFLVINETEAEAVRWLFRRYLDTDTSLRQLAKDLAAQGVVRPDGKSQGWTKDAVIQTLTNKVYAGYAYIGGPQGRRKGQTDYEEVAGAVPAIVSQEDWVRAQAKLAENKAEKRKVQPSRSSPLSGILTCGKCGYRLDKHSKTDGDGYEYVYFTCSSATKRPKLGCRQLQVGEDEVLPLVLKKLVEQVGREVLESHIAKMPETPDELTLLKDKEKELTAELEQGYRDFLSAPAHRKPSFEVILAEREQEREEVQDRIQEITDNYYWTTPTYWDWFHTIRQQLIWILDGEVGWREGTLEDVADFLGTTIEGLSVIPEELKETNPEFFDSEGNPILSEGHPIIPKYGKYLVKPDIIMENVSFRNLLKTLRVKVAVWWKPRLTTKGGKSSGSTRLHDVEIEMEIGGKRYREKINRIDKPGSKNSEEKGVRHRRRIWPRLG